MFYAKKTYDNAPEFLKSERYQNISCTVSDTGVTADEYGKKFVLAGTLLDAAGKAVKSQEAAQRMPILMHCLLIRRVSCLIP